MIKNNQFTPQAELDFYDSILNKANSPEILFGALLYKSTTFLKMGREKDAVNILESLLQTESSQPNSEKFHDRIKADLALAYLRMGEKNNCVNNHSSGSCIFPIQGKRYLYRSLCFTKKHSAVSKYPSEGLIRSDFQMAVEYRIHDNRRVSFESTPAMVDTRGWMRTLPLIN